MYLLGSLERLAQAAVTGVLATRPAPAHVAFIMDGNRRHAEFRGQAPLVGHTLGYGRMLNALDWCLDLGVVTVSVFAFSIDNYCRGEEEVAGLMRLAEEKFLHMLGESEVLERRGVRVRVLGNLALAPPSVRSAALHVQAATAGHDRVTLNICFSYTSSSEMLAALDAAGQDEPCCRGPACDGQAPLGAGASTSWQRHLATTGCPAVDLLVRTSGETRLSDFLLWQSRHAHLVFSDTLWPDFTFWDLASAVISWQHAAPQLEKDRAVAARRLASAAAAAAAGAVELLEAGPSPPRIQVSDGGLSSEVESDGAGSPVSAGSSGMGAEERVLEEDPPLRTWQSYAGLRLQPANS